MHLFNPQALKIALLITALAAVVGAGNHGVRKFWLEEESLPVQFGDVDMDMLRDPVSGEELHSLVKKDEDILILDVRSDFFFERGHIPGALKFEYGEFDKFYPAFVEKIKNARCVVIYCNDSNCDTSKTVASRLNALGHTNIFVYPGGWEEWGQRFAKK